MRKLLLAVSKWEWLLLLLLLPLFVLPPGFEALVLLVIPIFWVIRKLATSRFFPATPYNINLLMLTLAVLISLYAVSDFSLSMAKIAGLALGISLFFAAVEHCNQSVRGIWLILGALLAAGSAISLLAIFFADWDVPVQYLNGAKLLIPQVFSKLPGAVDGVINLNELAGVLAWIIPLMFAVTLGYGRNLWHSARPFPRLILLMLIAALVLNCLVWLASGSRGGILATVLGMLIMVAVQYKWGRWLLIIGVVAGIIALIGSAAGILPQIPVEALGLDSRLEIWSRGLYALSDFPVTGLGLNGFRQVAHVLYPFVSIPPYTDIAHAHNHLLQAGLDLGIGGLIAYLALWFLSAWLLGHGLHNKAPEDAHLHILQVGLVGSLAAGWLFGMVDTVALGARPGFIWWLLLALVFVATVDAEARNEVEGLQVTAV